MKKYFNIFITSLTIFRLINSTTFDIYGITEKNDEENFYENSIERLREIFYSEIMNCKKVDATELLKEVAVLENKEECEYSKTYKDGLCSWLNELYKCIESKKLKTLIEDKLTKSDDLSSLIQRKYLKSVSHHTHDLFFDGQFPKELSDNFDDNECLNDLHDEFYATISHSLVHKNNHKMGESKELIEFTYRNCNDMLDERALNSKAIDTLIDEMIEFTLNYLK